MLEYTCEEAKDLLTSKLDTAKNSLKNTLEDLEFLRSQITTMEVSILFFLQTNVYIF